MSAVPAVTGFDHLVLLVADVERSVAWYVDELGLAPERLDEWRRGEVPFPSVRISPTAVIDVVARGADGAPAARSGNVDHFCLVVDDDVHALAASGRLDVLTGPVPRWGAQGDATSIYVRDPDGNIVELRAYP
jgi:catechol 2,3-dioxygenase-like lactoylglutathione lyase family enzyme